MTLNLRLTTLLHIKLLLYIFTNIFQHCASICIYFVNCVMMIIVIVHSTYSEIYKWPQGRIAQKLIVIPSQNNV